MFARVALATLALAVASCSKPPPAPTAGESRSAPIRQCDPFSYFADKRPWDYPEIAPTRELLDATALAIEHFRSLHPRMEIFPHYFFEDRERAVVYLNFDRGRRIPPDASWPTFMVDFGLVYVYDPAAKRLTGYCTLPM